MIPCVVWAHGHGKDIEGPACIRCGAPGVRREGGSPGFVEQTCTIEVRIVRQSETWGVGSPGYWESVTAYADGREVASAGGPYTDGRGRVVGVPCATDGDGVMAWRDAMVRIAQHPYRVEP